MVRNIPYSASEIPHEWWSVCGYAADGLCPFPKFSNLFYPICIEGKCSLRNYREFAEKFGNERTLQIINLLEKKMINLTKNGKNTKP